MIMPQLIKQNNSKPVQAKKNIKPATGSLAKPVLKAVVKKTNSTKDAAKALYKIGNFVVYPTHGVGKILAEETQMIGDISLRMLVISFEKDKMTLRVPMSRATAAGLRPVSSLDQMKKVLINLGKNILKI